MKIGCRLVQIRPQMICVDYPKWPRRAIGRKTSLWLNQRVPIVPENKHSRFVQAHNTEDLAHLGGGSCQQWVGCVVLAAFLLDVLPENAAVYEDGIPAHSCWKPALKTMRQQRHGK